MEEIDDKMRSIVIMDENVPATVDDVNKLATCASDVVTRVSGIVNNVAMTVTELGRMHAQVKMQCQQLDHAFDVMLLKARRDVKMYEMTVPLLDNQLNSCQNRLDRLMDRAMDMLSDDFSDEALHRQEIAMSLIEMTNSSLSSLIAKLMPSL